MQTTQPTAEEADGPSDRIERLGRQRPEQFKTRWTECGFCFSLLASMLMAEYFISGFNVILPILATELNIPLQSQTWPASVFSLVTGAFLLPFGRLADIYGGQVIFVSGLAWFFVWSLIGGFSQNYIMLNFCRALQGLGPAAFLPSGIMLLGSIYRPGPRKNLVFSLYGAFSPIGFFSGIFFAGLSGQFLPWGCYFWIGAVLLFLVTIVAFLTVPSDRSERRSYEVKMDWPGVFTIVPGLILLVYAITDSSHAPDGWKTPYIYISLIWGIALLVGAFYVEGWIAKNPLLPFDLFRVRYMKALTLSLFICYGVFGIWLLYASFYIQKIMHASALQTTAWFAPMAAGGLILASTGGLVLHLLPGTILLILSDIGFIVSTLLFAIIPENANYWAYIFPAMVAATVGVDITYNVSNIFITTNLPKKQQGLAGALINSVLFLGISFFLGIADIVVNAVGYLGERGSYKVAFWLSLGMSGASMLILLLFIRVDRAKSDLTVEEKAAMEAEMMIRPINPSSKDDTMEVGTVLPS